MQTKSIEQLENDYWKEPSEFSTNLIERCFEYRKVAISELTIEQIRLLISQEIGTEYLMEIVLEILKQNIVAEGDLYEGDLLVAVSKIPTEFWSNNSVEFLNFKNIVELNKEKIISELGEKEYLRIKEIV